MKITILACILIALFPTTDVCAEGSEMWDKRVSLGLTAAEKAEFLAEMRQMLVSIQGIIAGIANEDRELIIKSARYSGNRMARATPDSVRNKLPQEFKEIGGPTHLMFKELVIRADSDDLESLTAFTAELIKQCTACHALYKVDD